MRRFMLSVCLCAIALIAGDLEDGIEAIKTKNYTKASENLMSSCENKNPRACSILGDMHRGEVLQMKDLEKSIFFFKKGCELEDGKSCYNLGVMYKDGEGTEKDLNTSAEYFSKGCGAEDGMSCYALAFMYKFGEGVSKDNKKVHNLFARACDLGFTKSCAKLASDYMRKTPQDISKATHFATKACAKNDIPSCRLLGIIYGDKGDFVNSSKYLDLGCSQKDGQSCYILSFLYAKAQGVEKDMEKAKELAKKSCYYGFANGCELHQKLDEKEK